MNEALEKICPNNALWFPKGTDQIVNTKGPLNSEWISEVIVTPKMPTKNLKDFCPTLY